jgi:DNA repair protein RadC
MFRGSLSQTMVYPREVAKTALALGADGMVKPSQADMKLTRTLQEALALIGVTVRDHIIVAQGKYLSMSEEGML